MRRKLPALILPMAIACVAGMPRDASATVTFSLVWTATTGLGVVGSSSMFGVIGDVLTLSIRMTMDQTLAGHGVSLLNVFLIPEPGTAALVGLGLAGLVLLARRGDR